MVGFIIQVDRRIDDRVFLFSGCSIVHRHSIGSNIPPSNAGLAMGFAIHLAFISICWFVTGNFYHRTDLVSLRSHLAGITGPGVDGKQAQFVDMGGSIAGIGFRNAPGRISVRALHIYSFRMALRIRQAISMENHVPFHIGLHTDGHV